jgi:hypothetical protein
MRLLAKRTLPLLPAPLGSEQQGPKIVNVSAGGAWRNYGKLPHKALGRERSVARMFLKPPPAAIRDDPKRSAE